MRRKKRRWSPIEIPRAIKEFDGDHIILHGDVIDDYVIPRDLTPDEIEARMNQMRRFFNDQKGEILPMPLYPPSRMSRWHQPPAE